MNKSISHYDNNVISLRLDLVRADGGTQMREALSPATVSEYAKALRAGAKFPPIDVFYDGSDYWPADGFHRLEAHHQAGLQEIDADVHDGTQRDAMLYAAGANADHGLRRSSEDKKRAVLTLLRDPEWRQWSDREIAGRVKVDHKTVAKYRRELDGEFPIETERRFTSRHGTEAKRTVANGASVKPGNESEEPVADVDKIPCGAEVVSASANCTPATGARLTSQDRWEEPSKRQHAPASDARAAEKQIEEALSRLAALPPSERAVVIEVAVDRWGLARSEEPAAEETDDDDIPSSHAQCIDLAALGSGWTDVVVAMAITRVIGTALYAPDAPKIPAPDQTRQLIKTLEQWLDRLQGRVEAQPGCNSAITVDAVGNGDIDEEGETAVAAGIANDAAEPVTPANVPAQGQSGINATIDSDAPPSMRGEEQDSDGGQDADHQVCSAGNGSTGLKYYPAADTDPYNRKGLVWIYGGIEIEIQLLPVIAKLKHFPKPFIDGTLERISQLFEMLEGAPPATYGLLRQYGYRDLVDQAIARADISDKPMPLLDIMTSGKP
jgi:uncharacterized ParB-like nuclease family protein